MRRLWRWCCLLCCLAVLTALTLVLLAPGTVLPPLAEFLDISESPRPADHVLVLNGDPNTRPFAAAALVGAGLVKDVLLTRQQLTLESDNVRAGVVLSELELTKAILQTRGVASELVKVLPGEIGGTGDEARLLAAFLKDHPEATVAVVTNGFHTRRARWIFHRALGPAAAQIYFVGVPRDGVDETTWWRTASGSVVYLSEYAKFAYYWLRY